MRTPAGPAAVYQSPISFVSPKLHISLVGRHLDNYKSFRMVPAFSILAHYLLRYQCTFVLMKMRTPPRDADTSDADTTLRDADTSMRDADTSMSDADTSETI